MTMSALCQRQQTLQDRQRSEEVRTCCFAVAASR